MGVGGPSIGGTARVRRGRKTLSQETIAEHPSLGGILQYLYPRYLWVKSEEDFKHFYEGIGA